MVRRLDRLLAFIEARTPVPFAWAQPYDCVSFAMKAVKVQTGRRLMGRLRWRTLNGAQRAIGKAGGIEQALDAQLKRIVPADAQRGDVAGVPDDRFGIRLMIVEGAALVGPGARGLRRLPRSAMVAAWSATEPPPAAAEVTNV
jgi:hypothetical protein